MTEKDKVDLERAMALDRRIAAGEISPKDAVELIVAGGGVRDMAKRRVAILTGQLKEPMPDPSQCPGGIGI